MEQLKIMVFLIIGVMAMMVSYYMIIVMVLLLTAYFFSKGFVSVKRSWNGK